MFSMTISLKHNGSQMYWHMTMLNIYIFHKSHQQSFLPWIKLAQNKLSMSFNRPPSCGNTQNLIHIDTWICEKMDTKILISHTNVTLKEGQGHPSWYKNAELSGLYYRRKFEINCSKNVWIQANIKVLFCFVCFLQNCISRVLFLEYWTTEIKWV